MRRHIAVDVPRQSRPKSPPSRAKTPRSSVEYPTRTVQKLHSPPACPDELTRLVQVIGTSTDFNPRGGHMLNGLISALFVVAGGACAVAGYMVGSWHQRRVMDADLVGELFGNERSFDLLGDEPPRRRDQRLN
jgi:hypothetical protein